jgi:hypothetical protein
VITVKAPARKDVWGILEVESMRRITRAVWLTILAWHLLCLAMLYIYRDIIGPIVTAAYENWYAKVQATYGTFERLHAFVSHVCITVPATIICLRLFARLSAQRTTWKVTGTVFALCEGLLVAVLTCSYETGFHYHVNQLGWAVFGPPDNVYSFVNIVLHRIITWVFCTTPIVWAALLIQLTLAKGIMASHHIDELKRNLRVPEPDADKTPTVPCRQRLFWFLALAGPITLMVVFLIAVIIFTLAHRS